MTTALAMQSELRRLMQKHGVATPETVNVPPLDAPDHDIIVEGIAADDSIDLQRMKFRKWAFTLMATDPLPPLLFRHGEPAGEVFRIWMTSMAGYSCERG